MKMLSQVLVVVLLSSLSASIGASTHAAWAEWSWEGLWRCSPGYMDLANLYTRSNFPISQTSASHRELWRTLGFASAPGVLRVFGAIPGLPGLRFSLPPCGCSLLRLLQYGRH